MSCGVDYILELWLNVNSKVLLVVDYGYFNFNVL